MRVNRRFYLILLVLLLSLSLACACPLTGLLGKDTATAVPTLPNVTRTPKNTPIPATATPEPLAELSQWAAEVKASSQFGNMDFSAKQALGEPDAFNCDDNPNAWGPNFDSPAAWIELYFDEAVYPEAVTIYQAYWTDGVAEVQLIDLNGALHPVYLGSVWLPETCPYQTEIGTEEMSVPVHGVRIRLDMESMQAWWTAIDAVELRGMPLAADDPLAQLTPMKPTLAANDFSFNNRWSHYLPMFDSLDPRYDFGSTYSIQWETVNDYGEIHDWNGSEFMAVPFEDEQVNLSFVSADTMNLWSIDWPLALVPGKVPLNVYDPYLEKNAPSSLLYIADEFYAGQEGIIEIFESPPGTVTAKLLLFLVDGNDPSRDAVVMAFFNQLPVNE